MHQFKFNLARTTLLFFLVSASTVGRTQQPTQSLRSSGRLVLTYNASFVASPDPSKEWLGRSGFLHPIFTPAGHAVTEAFPIKQTHQHGLMFAWTSGEYHSKPLDFWNSEAKQGRVRHQSVVEADDDHLVVKLEHVSDLTTPETVILEETWNLSLVPDSTDHVFDLDLKQINVTTSPLAVNKYHYGGLCVRGSDAWMNESTMLTSDGKHRVDGNHTRPRWIAMFGKIAGNECGIAVLDHPTNERHPQPVRLHPSNPYFCYAPMVLGRFEITQQQPFQSRFRVVAFDGPADAGRLNEHWIAFSQSSTQQDVANQVQSPR